MLNLSNCVKEMFSRMSLEAVLGRLFIMMVYSPSELFVFIHHWNLKCLDCHLKIYIDRD